MDRSLRRATPARILLAMGLTLNALALLLATSAAGAKPPKPTTTWLPADKQGFGTARSLASPVWFTLEGGELSEVYYPRLDTPSVRDLQFVVTDRRGHVERERDATIKRTVLLDQRSLTYQQINTERRHRWRLTKTYVTDPSRATVMISVRFQSLDGGRYRVAVLAQPQLSNATGREIGGCSHGVLIASNGQMSSIVATRPALRAVACTRQRGGVILQTGLTSLGNGRAGQSLTLALSFGRRPQDAHAVARSSLRTGFRSLAARYAAGWHGYLTALRAPPASLMTAAERREYTVSQMVLAASEDKTHPGAFVASPTMPWQWATGLQLPTGPYHLVWSRDLYEIATALIADGDTAGARRALQFLLLHQQKQDGSFPQNSDVTGKPVLTNLQLDEVADPIILAGQLGANDPVTWTHVRRAAEFLLSFHMKGHRAPWSPQERWENQPGYSPATIGAEIAGLVCAAQIAQHNGDGAAAARYLATADAWQARVDGWTATHTGPYAGVYYLRLSENGNPNVGATYSIGDSGPPKIDQRRVVDPSFLELVRLGIKPAEDPTVLSSLRVVDAKLGVATSRGMFWHRYSDDGYGEQRTGAPWGTQFKPGSRATIGRAWPIFAGERGEYELLAGSRGGAAAGLAAIAAASNAGGLLPEQVWDRNPPGGPRFRPGSPTTSATPLAWTHAQFIRLAWSLQAGAPVEQPSVVACRYVRACP